MHIPGSALIGLVTISALSLSGVVGAAQTSPFLRPATSVSQVAAPQGAAGAPQGVGGDGIDGTPTPQTPAPPATPVAPGAPVVPVPGALPPPMGRVFASDAGMIFSTVRPDKVMDFEMGIERIHQALAMSADAVRRQQAKGWKVFKGIEPGPNSTVLYVFMMDPAVKGADYTISKVLSEAFPDEVREIYKLYNASIISQSLENLTLIADFAKPFEAKPVTPGQLIPAVPEPGSTLTPTRPTPTTSARPGASTSSPTTTKPATPPRGKNDPIVTAPIVIDPDDPTK